MVSANGEPTSEIMAAPFLPGLLKFSHRCDGTGAVPAVAWKAARRLAGRFFSGLEIGHSQIKDRPLAD